MITRIADTVSSFFVKENFVNGSERDKCRYGLEIILSTIIGFAAILFAGMLLKNIEIAFFYLFCIVPIRMYTGGYHANTYWVCNVVFTIIFIINLFLYKMIITYHIEHRLLELTLFSIFPVLRYAPIENKNKRLTVINKNKYRKISLILYALYYSTAFLMIQNGKKCGVMVLLVLNTVSILIMEVKINEKIKPSIT